ncbi:MAG: FlgD immunoglobulin-like domain containing protein [Ignavibacteriaceae bacterium]
MKTINFPVFIILILVMNSIIYSQAGKNNDSPGLVYSTFLGGSGNDATWWLDEPAIDSEGNICLALDTDSRDFPVTENAYNRAYNGGNHWGMEDIAIVKFNVERNRLSYSSYFGGSNGPEFVSQIVASGNELYITGNLGSSNFPVTENAFDKTFNGPDFRHADAFISKFDNNNLVYSSFIGTSGNEGASNLFINNKNELVVITQLAKPDEFIITSKFYNGILNPEYAYTSVLRFNASGDSLLSASQLGPVWGLVGAIDDSGYIYLTGSTSDSTFPVTNDSYDNTYNGGDKIHKGDFFITKLSPAADSIIFSTFIGGTGDESYPKIVLDKDYNIILFGTTESNDYPLTENAIQKIRKGVRDFVITKLSRDGKEIVYSSLIGSTEISAESNSEIAIHKNGDVYLAGSTDGPDFPVTPNALSAVNNGKRDIFFTILNNTLDEIKYSTYLGGQEDDMLPSLIFNDDENAVIIGTTSSPDFPVTSGCYDSTFNGGNDLFICAFNSFTPTTFINTGSINTPERIFINQNYPNPFNPSTTINYRLSESSDVKLKIYNSLGQEIKTLVDSFRHAGEHSVIWNATDNKGHQVSQGVYYYSLVSGDINLQKKMILIK